MHLASGPLRLWERTGNWIPDKVSTSQQKGPCHRLRASKKPQEPNKQEHPQQGPVTGLQGPVGREADGLSNQGGKKYNV